MLIRTIAICVAMLLQPILFSGCSVIGYAVGHSVDSARDKNNRVSSREIADLKKGKKVSVWTANEGLLHGRFVGTVKLTPQEYSDHYLTCLDRLPNSSFLPELGSQVVLDLVNGEVLSGAFGGFDLMKDAVSVQPTEDSTAFLSGRIGVSIREEEQTSLVGLREINSIWDENNLYAGDSLRTLAAANRLPLYTGLKIVTNDFREHRIAMSDILQAEILRHGNTRWVMMGLGLVLDVGMILFYSVVSRPPIE